MKISQLAFLLIVLASSVSFAKVKSYAPDGTPTRSIQSLDDMLDAYILSPQTEAERQFNADLKKKVLHGTFDIRYLCELAMSKHWKSLSGRERNRFVNLMVELLERKAIFSKERAGGKSSKNLYFVTYENERFLDEKKNHALVHTFVKIPSENLQISLDYKLNRLGPTWKIYDVVVDDASLVDNYRYQFDKIISQHGYEDLVHRMESKLKEIGQKEGGGPPLTESPPPPSVEPEKKGGCSLFDHAR